MAARRGCSRGGQRHGRLPGGHGQAGHIYGQNGPYLRSHTGYKNLNLRYLSASLALSFEDAVARLHAGKGLVYPTETFFGLGCKATDHEAVALIAQCKTRPVYKPVPVIAGSVEQLALLTPGFAERPQENAFEAIAAAFWPGPVAVLLPARQELPRPLHGATGHVAARICGHPLARRLCLEAGEPLTATSANQSGEPPAARLDELDPELVRAVGGYIAAEPQPAGGRPSTIVSIEPDGSLRVVREGIVPTLVLEQAGFCIVS
ncbi:threonylcarbamoyl-AMP synthase [Oceanidesulfovibrio marinus]|uniref:L-threonylcarbamoyladenylate synthase n=1 Tax=Oceanidesulfovibrio marinus TaxID=370038 RepID=A0ABX6NB12_9BACT|nr:threonylcarbamoyl-AMP synthase [Oceanidesulfovibrio marinus]